MIHDTSIPGPLLPTAEETREYFAKRLLDRMVATAKRGEMTVTHSLARSLRGEYPDAAWGILGIYWYCLLVRQVEKALVCEQIMLKRAKSLDHDQGMFYRKCLLMQQALQGTLRLHRQNRTRN